MPRLKLQAETMREILEHYLSFLCAAKVRRSEACDWRDRRNQQRFEDRTGQAAAIGAHRPPVAWDLDPRFNPYYVRKRIPQIAHALARRFEAGDWQPGPALIGRIPKPSGGERIVARFTLPDQAVARYAFDRLMKANQSRFSPSSYAYRGDRGAADAIEFLSGELPLADEACFLVEYDFSDYFDSIDHAYLLDVLDRRFAVAPLVLPIVQAFLNCKCADEAGWARGEFRSRGRGVPPGLVLSLFLANVAAHELDLDMESLGVAYARYSDDTIAICRDLDTANAAAAAIARHAKRAGLRINSSKSPGISILGFGRTGAERRLSRKYSLDFLGHRLAGDTVSIALRTECKIRARIEKVLYLHLLREPSGGRFDPKRLQGGLDRDLLSTLCELRRYLYGRMPESDAQAWLAGEPARRAPKRALMAFFRAVDDIEHLKQLDSWMLDALMRVLRRRAHLLTRDLPPGLRLEAYPLPTRETLINGNWPAAGRFRLSIGEARAPSFYRAWTAVRKARRARRRHSSGAPPIAPLKWEFSDDVSCYAMT